MSKAVINGEIKHLSATAFHTFNPKEFGGCPRRWFLKYVVGLPEEPQLSQITGVKIHKHIEEHLLKGKPIDNLVVRAGACFIPQPGSVEVEKPTAGVLTAAGIPLIGFIDVYNRGPIYIDSLGKAQLMPDKQVEVVDWKTTSDLKYSKTGKELITTQMVSYAKFATTLQPELESVRLSHVYFVTKGIPASVKNSTVITLDTILDRYQAIEQVAEQIKTTAKIQRVEDVPANRAACTAFRGCPFINQCPKDIGGQMLEQGLSMLQKLRAAKAGATQQAPAPKEETRPEVTQEIDRIEEDYNQAGKVLGTCPECQKQVTNITGSLTPSGKVKHLQGCSGVAIVPPDAPQPQSLPQTPVPAPEPPTVNVEENRAYTPPQAPVAPTKRTRGPNKPKPQPTPGEVSETKETPPEPEEGLTLFVDSRFTGKKKLEAKPLEPFIVEALELLSEEAKIPDIRLAENQNPMAYGKWKVYLALQMVSFIHEGRLKGCYTLFDVKDSEVKQIVLEALTPHFDLVIRSY